MNTVHLYACIRQYARYGDVQSAERKFTLCTLLRLAGRSAEPALITYEHLRIDFEHKCAYVISPQSKTHKAKIAMLMAGSNREACWLLSLADMLTSTPNRVPFDVNKAAWLDESMQTTTSPNAKVTDILQALLPLDKGGSVKFQHHTVPSLPPQVTGGSPRVGLLTELAARMPAEFVAYCSGHELKNMSSLFEYIDADKLLSTPGGLRLAGWPTAPWGQTSVPAASPELSPLVVKSLVPPPRILSLVLV